MINVFIPHRWNNHDYETISSLLDRTKYKVRDYSVPKDDPLEKIDLRFKVDPQIKKQIRYAGVVVCSNRPANNNGMSIDEIAYAISIGKPVVSIKLTEYTSQQIAALHIPVISNNKSALEAWIDKNVYKY